MERSEKILDRLIVGPEIAVKSPHAGDWLLSLLDDQLVKSGIRPEV